VAAFSLGLFGLLLGADWPVHDLAERYLYSVHMVQHMLFSLVVPPLLLMGTPGWLARELLRAPRVFAVVRRLARPVPATIAFNAVLVTTHWPAFVDFTLRSEPAHFGAHAVLFTAALLLWCPVPASFLTFTDKPIYHFYAEVPRLWGLSATDDQRIGGLLMKLGGGFLLWAVITVLFFRWHVQEERTEAHARHWRELERELDGTRWSNR
jgi:putative membrane protein